MTKCMTRARERERQTRKSKKKHSTKRGQDGKAKDAIRQSFQRSTEMPEIENAQCSKSMAAPYSPNAWVKLADRK